MKSEADLSEKMKSPSAVLKNLPLMYNKPLKYELSEISIKNFYGQPQEQHTRQSKAEMPSALSDFHQQGRKMHSAIEAPKLSSKTSVSNGRPQGPQKSKKLKHRINIMRKKLLR